MSTESLILRLALATAVTTAFVSVATSCGGGAVTDRGQPTPSSLVKSGGDAQSGPVAAVLSSPLTVLVSDGQGAAMPGVTVTWAIVSGAGSVSPGSSGTDATGHAATNWTLGTLAGAQTASAAVAGLAPATFGATALPGSAATVAKQAGDNQTAAAGAAVATPPAVIVKDAYANPKPGVTVTFAAATGGGSVSGAVPTTDASGVAAVGGWTLGTSAGTNTLSATVSGSGIAGNPVTFTATGTSGGTTPTLLFQESFDDANLAARGWYDLRGAAIDSTQHIAGSAASAKANFVVGQSSPSPALGGRHLFTASSSVYVRYWVMFSSNWTGSGLNYQPHEFYLLTNADGQYVGPASTHLTTNIEHNYQPAGGYAVLSTQDAANIDAANINVNLIGVTENRAVSGCNGNEADGASYTCYSSNNAYYNGRTWKSPQPVFLPNPGAGYKANWNEVEVYFQMNSIVNGIGQADGIVKYWINGQLVIDQENVTFRTGANPSLQWNQLLFAPYMDNGPPQAEQAWYDELVVMTGRP